MPLAPIEIITLVFPGSRFTGQIMPELTRLVEDTTITIIDGIFVSVDARGEAAYTEIDELDANSDAAALIDVVKRFDELISDDDVRQLVAGLEPGSSAAILVFEHTWMKPLRDAIVESGGVLRESIRIPGAAVEEVLAAVAELEQTSTEGERP